MILPPQCIGILGGGQLGMLLALVAKQFGYSVAILEPEQQCPASKVADWHICRPYDDQEGLQRLASLAAVVTTEFENIPAVALEFLATKIPVYPNAASIMIAQNRLKEKEFFRSCGLNTAPYIAINSLNDCQSVPQDLFPGILKTTTLGYDGKGQVKVTEQNELANAFRQLNASSCIFERCIELKEEISVIVARNSHGTVTFPAISNQHANGILDISFIPAQLSPTLATEADNAARLLATQLDYTGILTVEFFVTRTNELLVNEIAPRPHNSGHITIEAVQTSQFEQQLRAICGLPLSSTALKQPGAMLNLLGDSWLDPDNTTFATLLTEFPQAKLYWYGKQAAKAGRKMGHLSLSMPNLPALLPQISAIKQRLAAAVKN